MRLSRISMRNRCSLVSPIQCQGMHMCNALPMFFHMTFWQWKDVIALPVFPLLEKLFQSLCLIIVCRFRMRMPFPVLHENDF